MDLTEVKIINGYKLGKKLGTGGYSIVVEAIDSNGRQVALKILEEKHEE